MAVIYDEIIEGHEANTSVNDGPKLTKVYIVTELTGSDDKPAMALEMAGVPKIGDFHPTYPLICTSATAIMIDQEKAKVTIVYQILSNKNKTANDSNSWAIRISNGLQNINTDIDNLGNLITVDYTDASGNVKTPQAKVIDVGAWVPTITYSRRQTSNWCNMAPYVGCINKNAEGILSPARAWMCIALDSSTNDGGKSWEVSVTFQRAPYRNIKGKEPKATYDTILYYRDALGQIPDDVIDIPTDLGKINGVNKICLPPLASFGALGLSNLIG